MDIRNQNQSNSNSEKPAQASSKASGEKLMQLSFSAGEEDSVSRDFLAVLAKVSERIKQCPDLLMRGATCFRLECAVSPAYVPASGDAVRVSVAFREDGRIYDLSEHFSRSGSGGWAGCSIPSGRLRRFFEAWLEQTDPTAVEQFSLFA